MDLHKWQVHQGPSRSIKVHQHPCRSPSAARPAAGDVLDEGRRRTVTPSPPWPLRSCWGSAGSESAGVTWFRSRTSTSRPHSPPRHPAAPPATAAPVWDRGRTAPGRTPARGRPGRHHPRPRPPSPRSRPGLSPRAGPVDWPPNDLGDCPHPGWVVGDATAPQLAAPHFGETFWRQGVRPPLAPAGSPRPGPSTRASAARRRGRGRLGPHS
jgi:hypothetical protein